MLELQFCGSACEEFNIFRVGTWPATFNELHAEIIQLFGNTELVFNSGRDAFYLHAVTQGGVECFN